MKNTAVEFWAHMLDESFNKMPAEQKPLPNNENEKFRFGDVFTKEVVDTTDEALKKVLDVIWPDWYNYFCNKVSSIDNLEFNGEQTAIDDWDTWEISLENCYGGIDDMIEIMFEHMAHNYDMNKILSLKELLDDEITSFCENANEHVDLDKLETYGRRTYKGHVEHDWRHQYW